MSELTYLLLRLGLLAMLWVFVLFAVRAIRVDVFGPRVPRAARPEQRAAARPQAKPKPAKAGRTPRHLLITEGSLAGTSIDLADAPVTIGRAPESTLVITDDYASNHHARLIPRDGAWLVEDLGSTNGTYVDRQRISAPTPLRVGSTVRIGRTVLELRR